MKISEVMTRDVETVSADQTAQEAAAFMLSAEAGSIPVCDGDKVIGMITDRDIAVRGVAEGRGPETPVRDLMSDGRHLRPRGRRCRRRRPADERSAGPPAAGGRRPTTAGRHRQPGRSQPREPAAKQATQALEGVSAPGGQHQQ